MSSVDHEMLSTESGWSAGAGYFGAPKPAKRIEPSKRFIRSKGYTQIPWVGGAGPVTEKYGMYQLFDTSIEDRSDFLHGYDSTVFGRATGQKPAPGGGGLEAEAIYGSKASARNYDGADARSNNIEYGYSGGQVSYKRGAGRHRGYDLYWKPGTFHRKSDDVIQELDHSMLDNIRYANPLAGPLSPIPPSAKEYFQFQTGEHTQMCGTGNSQCGGMASGNFLMGCSTTCSEFK